MPASSSDITTISAASAAAAQLPSAREAVLPGGEVVPVKRLSWLQFEALWSELAALLSSVADTPPDAAPEQFARALATAPACVLQLCALCTPLGEPALAAMPYDSVLAIAAAALELNFIDSAGVRRFFTALTGLPAAMSA